MKPTIHPPPNEMNKYSSAETVHVTQTSTSNKRNEKIALEENNSDKARSKKRKLEETVETSCARSKPKRKSRPFDKLMKDVTFTISGIQNPERAEMRSLAMKMGAKYKQDWDSSCTHLM